jgi:hypothetical protein
MDRNKQGESKMKIKCEFCLQDHRCTEETAGDAVAVLRIDSRSKDTFFSTTDCREAPICQDCLDAGPHTHDARIDGDAIETEDEIEYL